jgi:hypothetical protein
MLLPELPLSVTGVSRKINLYSCVEACQEEAVDVPIPTLQHLARAVMPLAAIFAADCDRVGCGSGSSALGEVNVQSNIRM